MLSIHLENGNDFQVSSYWVLNLYTLSNWWYGHSNSKYLLQRITIKIKWCQGKRTLNKRNNEKKYENVKNRTKIETATKAEKKVGNWKLGTLNIETLK